MNRTWLPLSTKINVETVLYVFAMTVTLFLRVVYVAMFLQAILSWFIMDDSPVMVVLSAVTLPIIYPVRAILSRIPALARFPIDISFLVAFVLLVIVMGALPAIPPPG